MSASNDNEDDSETAGSSSSSASSNKQLKNRQDQNVVTAMTQINNEGMANIGTENMVPGNDYDEKVINNNGHANIEVSNSNTPQSAAGKLCNFILNRICTRTFMSYLQCLLMIQAKNQVAATRCPQRATAPMILLTS